MPQSPRRTSQRVATSPGCAPLHRMYQAAVEAAARRWDDVEDSFLRAMWAFDDNFARGVANQGDNQNCKGDSFTDLISLLLENATGRELYGRGSVPGLFFAKHNLDASYPASGPVKLVIETKVAGAPKTGRNPRQKNALGRPGSSDLRKRITELGLKTIDLKAQAASAAGKGGGPTGGLVTWLRRSPPLCFLFLAVRVVDGRDLSRTIQEAETASRILDEVGLVAFGPGSSGREYAALPVPTQLQLDRLLARVTTDLKNL
jgi:hypothetical protein